MYLKRMGVINVTPDSFSDGGELTPQNFLERFKSLGPLEAVDIGAESTAPMNQPISWAQEWERLLPFMPLLKQLPCILSFDTYHPETIEEILRFSHDHHWTQKIIWNDVSGKFDGFVRDFLSCSPDFSYVLCHNLAPSRAHTGKHMDYIDLDLTLEKISDYFSPLAIPQVIFDPCFGFSKTYEQNWEILNRFGELQLLTKHDQWLLGLSRKSFLRKKYHLSLSDKDQLDQIHNELISRTEIHGNVWLRSHQFRS
jgi:dihydropteroate synthase